MPLDDPALGLTGTLTTLQQQPMVQPAGSLPDSQDNTGQAAEELSRAARSLQSVQGNVSGQTQAIQQMTMAAQQQSAMLNMAMSQLGVQISTLVQSVNKLSTSMMMGGTQTYTPQAMGPMPPMDYGVGGGGGPIDTGGRFAGYGGMARSAAGAAWGGTTAGMGFLNRAGTAVGGAASGIASPFFGTPIWAPEPGTVAPRMSPDVGMWGSAVMATGAGMTPGMTRYAGGRLSELGRERFQERFGDVALGAMGGTARMASGLFAGEAGMRLGGLVGGGLGTWTLGGPIGAALAAPGSYAINETMEQAGNIRGFGSQYARNAFRFMPQGQMGFQGLRKPGMRQRMDVGQAMNRMSIEDLTYEAGDIQDIFAGMSQQDLMRAVGSQDEVVQRIRQGKETIKLIGRRMGQSIQEAAGTMGELQALGFDPTSGASRQAIFGASSIQGLTPTEAAQRGAAVGRQYVGQGLGQEMYGMGLMGAQAAQVGIQRGTLTNRQVAAWGGREGAGQALPQLAGAFLESDIGRSMLLAGGPGATAGMGLQQMIGRGGAMATGDINRLIELQLGGDRMKREAMQDPRFMAQMFQRVRDMAQVHKRGGANDKMAMLLALKQLNPEMGYTQLEGMLQQMKGLPEAARQQAQQLAASTSEEMRAATEEQVAIIPKLKRMGSRLVNPVAEGLEENVTAAGTAMGNVLTDVYRGVTGQEVVSTGRGLDVGMVEQLQKPQETYQEKMIDPKAALRGLVGKERLAAKKAIDQENKARAQRNGARVMQKNIFSKKNVVKERTRNEIDRAFKSAVATPGNEAKIAELKDTIKNGDPGEKQEAMADYLDLISNGVYKTLDTDPTKDLGGKNYQVLRAIYEKAQEDGVDAGAVMGGGPEPKSFTKAEREELATTRSDLRTILDLEDTESAAFLEDKSVADFFKAASDQAGGLDVDMGAAYGAMEKSIGKAGAKRVKQIVDQQKEQGVEWFGAGLFTGSGFFSGAGGIGDIAGQDTTSYEARMRIVAEKLAGGGYSGGKGAIALGKKQGTEVRLGAAGGELSKTLLALRQKGGEGEFGKGITGLIADLGSGKEQRMLEALGKLPDLLSKEDAAALSEEEFGPMGKMLATARRVARDGEITKKDMIDLGLDEKQMEELEGKGTTAILAQAFAGARTEAPLTTTAREGTTLTGDQAGRVYQFMEQTNKLSQQVAEISRILKSMQ